MQEDNNFEDSLVSSNNATDGVQSISQSDNVQPIEKSSPEVTQITMNDIANPGRLKKFKKSFFLIIITVSVLLLAVGGVAAYLGIFEKTPEELLNSALQNTKTGLNEFIEVSENRSPGTKIKSNFSVAGPVVAEGSIEGHLNGANGNSMSEIAVSGVRLNAEIRSIVEKDKKIPDIYFKIGGLSSVSAILGIAGGAEAEYISGIIDNVNDQWYIIDRTLVAQSLIKEEQSSTDNSLSEEDAKLLSENLSRVISESLFSTEEGKAIFDIVENVGYEDFEGTPSYKYIIKPNKNGLKSLIQSMETTVKEANAEYLLSGKSLDMESIYKSIEEADMSKFIGNLWVEENGKYIRNIRFYPVDDKKDTNFIEIGFPYTGSDVLPILLKVVADENGEKGNTSILFEMNKTNANLKITLNADVNSSENEKMILKVIAEIIATDEEVKVEVPADAKNVYELLGIFENLFNGSTSEALPFVPNLFEQTPTGFEEI